jgi:hypothetical protein
LAPDQPDSFQTEHDSASLQVSLCRRAAKHQRVGMDEGEIRPLLSVKAGGAAT